MPRKRYRSQKKRNSSGRRGNSKGTNALKIITQRAREYYENDESLSWKEAISRASADYRRKYG